jgi:hypothetical protein
MTPELNRRLLLRAGVVALGSMTVPLIAGCEAVIAGATPTSRATDPATASTTPSPATLSADSGIPRPVQSASYGPNATHYPADLPWLGETAAKEVEVDCTWTAIAAAVKTLTAAQVAAGVTIRVRPGELPGAGSGSTAKPVLSLVGSDRWRRNVLICPRDGYGTVTVSASGIRMDQCGHLSFFGFASEGGFVFTRCMAMQMGWGRWSSANATIGGIDIAMYELVVGFRRNENDTSGIRPSGANPMTNVTRYGCTFGPSIKAAGSGAHSDTIQLEGVGTGTFGPFISVDCVDYGSSNAVIQVQPRVTRVEYRHSLLLGGELPWRVFPLQDGDYVSAPNALSGRCNDVQLYDSVVCGAIGALTYTRVENTLLSYQPQAKQQPTVSGTWTVDTGITSWDAEQIMGMQSTGYTAAELTNLWRW